MKFPKQLLFILAAFFSFHMLIAQGFEGVILMKKFEADTQRTTRFQVKGNLVLVEMITPNGLVKVINDRESKRTVSLFSKKGKKYAFLSSHEDKPEIQVDERQKLIMEMAKKQISMEVTDDYRQIGNYACQKIVGQDHKDYIEAWVTDSIDISIFDLFPTEQQSAESEELDIQKKIWEHGFVMEYWTKSKSDGGISKVTFELMEMPVPDEVFGYNKDEYYAFDKNTLNQLYLESAKNPEKMQQLRELLDAFQAEPQ